VSASEIGGGLGEIAGLNQFTKGSNLINTGNSMVPYATQALTAGFDPMGSVYKQQFQQNTDQTRALEEARGIDSTPYGAGVEAQSDLNFNNAWLQNTLARQGQGAQTANTLFGSNREDLLAGTGLQTGAPGTIATSGAMPYNTNQTIGMNQLGAIGAGQGIQQQPITDWQTYLNYVNQAAGVGTQQQQTNLNQANANFAQSQAIGGQIGAGLQGLGKAYGQLPTGGGGGTGNWQLANTGQPGSNYQGPVA
jgi:hypothetical protein